MQSDDVVMVGRDRTVFAGDNNSLRDNIDLPLSTNLQRKQLPSYALGNLETVLPQYRGSRKRTADFKANAYLHQKPTAFA
jgi:hypothetical protein